MKCSCLKRCNEAETCVKMLSENTVSKQAHAIDSNTILLINNIEIFCTVKFIEQCYFFRCVYRILSQEKLYNHQKANHNALMRRICYFNVLIVMSKVKVKRLMRK